MDDIDENWIGWNSLDKAKYGSMLMVASGLGTLISQPFYVLTTRQQAGTKLTGDKLLANEIVGGVFQGLKTSIKKIGIRGLFRGWLPLSFMSIPANILYFGATESTRETIRGEIFARYPHTPLIIVDMVQSVFTALVSDTLFQTVYAPGEVIAARMIVQNAGSRLSIRDTIRSIVSESGAKGLYRGYGATLLTSVCSSSIWWCSYSASRRALGALYATEDDAIYVDAMCGVVSGIIETVGTHPFDTIRARIMTGATRHTTVMPAIKSLVQKEGVGALWRGLYPSLCQTIWSSMVFAVAYESIKRAANLNKFGTAVGYGDDE